MRNRWGGTSVRVFRGRHLTQKSRARPRPGHLFVDISAGGRVSRKWVHRLVLEAFVGPCPAGTECCHGDGDPTNNHVENLRWDTHATNMAEANCATGSRHGMAKLLEADVIRIRHMVADGVTQLRVAAIFGVQRSTICNIVSGRTWKHVGGPVRQAALR